MDKKFGMTQKTRKALCSLFLAGGLFGTRAQAAVTTTPTIPDRVAAVRTEMNKRVAEAQAFGRYRSHRKTALYADASRFLVELGQLAKLEQLGRLE
jgi:hypothetical protein